MRGKTEVGAEIGIKAEVAVGIGVRVATRVAVADEIGAGVRVDGNDWARGGFDCSELQLETNKLGIKHNRAIFFLSITWKFNSLLDLSPSASKSPRRKPSAPRANKIHLR